jgi:hypothetical protein
MGEIKGPLGLWNFPLLTMIMSLMQGGAGQSTRSLNPVMKNDEIWRWVDYKGREREFVISREVKG